MTTTRNAYPEVPIPAGAFEVRGKYPDTLDAYRYFTGLRRVIAPDNVRIGIGTSEVEVYVDGAQKGDGTVERHIVVGGLHPDNPITIKQTQQLGAALLEVARAAAAADEQDRMASPDEIAGRAER